MSEQTERQAIATARVLAEIADERVRQDAKWGEQNHPSGAPDELSDYNAKLYRDRCQAAAATGQLTWRHILLEEVYEALAEHDVAKLRAELVQSAAVLAAWIEAIDRRGGA